MDSMVLLEAGFFDTIAGLPLHPLVVHLAVVMLPLSALGLLAILPVRAWRRRFGALVVIGLAVGAVAAFVAKESGEALAERVGLPQDHAVWGDRLPLVAIPLFLVAGAWYLLARRAEPHAEEPEKPKGSLPQGLLGILAALLAVGTLIVTVLVGHSGAQAVWAAEIEQTASPTDSASPSASESATTSSPSASRTTSPAKYTMAQVKQHDSASSCWTVVNDTVYDVTEWIGRHPGGRNRILGMCGRDATTDFERQHGSSAKAQRFLAGFKLGPLG